MADNEIFYDDLKVGDSLSAGPMDVTKTQIIRYSRRYDPRPYHVDPEAAKLSIFGGLVAPGGQILSYWNKLRFDAEDGLAQLATLSLNNVHFTAPVRPNDQLKLQATLRHARRSLGKPDRGLMTFNHIMFNQADTPVVEVDVVLLVARRPFD